MWCNIWHAALLQGVRPAGAPSGATDRDIGRLLPLVPPVQNPVPTTFRFLWFIDFNDWVHSWIFLWFYLQDEIDHFSQGFFWREALITLLSNNSQTMTPRKANMFCTEADQSICWSPSLIDRSFLIVHSKSYAITSGEFIRSWHFLSSKTSI